MMLSAASALPIAGQRLAAETAADRAERALRLKTRRGIGIVSNAPLPAAPPFTLADWCCVADLTAEDFAADDVEQKRVKRRRREKGPPDDTGGADQEDW